MKPEMKIEGDKLVLKVEKAIVVDTDGDKEHSIKAAISVDLEVDGSEVLSELFKSSSLVEKAKDLIAKIGKK